MMHVRSSALGLTLLLCFPVTCLSAEPPTRVEVHLATDIVVTLAAASIGTVPHLLREEFVLERCAPNCDRSRINAFDALTIGFKNEDAAMASNALLGVTFMMPALIGMIDVLVNEEGEGWSGYGKDLLLVAQSVAVTSMIHSLTKFAAQRPRPYVFDESASMAERTGADSMLSFFSGHAATGFAAATSYSYLFTLRHPNSPYVPAVWVTMMSLATAESVVRPFTGEHYWTDVIIGAAVGAATGLLIPYLHTSDAAIHIGPHDATLAVTPIALVGGGGVGVSVMNW